MTLPPQLEAACAVMLCRSFGIVAADSPWCAKSLVRNRFSSTASAIDAYLGLSTFLMGLHAEAVEHFERALQGEEAAPRGGTAADSDSEVRATDRTAGSGTRLFLGVSLARCGLWRRAKAELTCFINANKRVFLGPSPPRQGIGSGPSPSVVPAGTVFNGESLGSSGLPQCAFVKCAFKLHQVALKLVGNLLLLGFFGITPVRPPTTGTLTGRLHSGI